MLLAVGFLAPRPHFSSSRLGLPRTPERIPSLPSKKELGSQNWVWPEWYGVDSKSWGDTSR